METCSPTRGAGMGSSAAKTQVKVNDAVYEPARSLPLANKFANKNQGTLCFYRCIPQGDIMIKEKRKTKFTRVLLNALLPETHEFNLKKARCK